MRVLLNNSKNAYEEDFEVAEILNLFFDDEDGMCFIFADESNSCQHTSYAQFAIYCK